MSPLDPGTILLFVVLWLVIAVGVALVIRELFTQLQRAKRQIRLRQLWARERRADLARLISLFIAVREDGQTSGTRPIDFENELRKQAKYVRLEWARAPTSASGLMPPEKLTRRELAEMLKLSNETLAAIGWRESP